jgi:hypothetical protein
MPLFQLTGPQATTAGPRCSESCRSVDWCASTCKVDKNSSVQTTATTKTHHPSPSLLQLTVAQATTADPRRSQSCRSVDCCSRTCKSDEINGDPLFRTTQTHRPSPSLFQLTVAEATTAGPRCSGSCRSVDCCPRTCKSDEINGDPLFRPTQTHHPSSPHFHSQDRKQRQLAHGARNRAAQLIAGQ